MSLRKFPTDKSLLKPDRVSHISEEDVSEMFPAKDRSDRYSKEVVRKIAGFLNLKAEGALTFRSITNGSQNGLGGSYNTSRSFSQDSRRPFMLKRKTPWFQDVSLQYPGFKGLKNSSGYHAHVSLLNLRKKKLIYKKR